jgi:hypothetical protein
MRSFLSSNQRIAPRKVLNKAFAKTSPVPSARSGSGTGTLDSVKAFVRNSRNTAKNSDLRALALKGYKKAVGQSFTASSISMNLRVGSGQLRSLLGTGLASALGSAGIYVGFAAAGLRTAAGAGKVVEAVRIRDFGKALDGFKDFGSASVLGLTCAGMWAARKVALPAAAGFDTFRGGFNFVAGWVTNDKRRQARGLFDGVGAAGRTGRALKTYSPFLGKAGLVLAPVAGALQIKRGLDSLSLGLEKNNNKVELRGLVDIASAVGTTLLFTGIAATPGLAIFSVAQFISTTYAMSATVRKVVDPILDKMEPTAIKIGDGIKGLKAEPIDRLRKLPNPFFCPREESNGGESQPATHDPPVGEDAVSENDSAIWYNEWSTVPVPADSDNPEAPDDL